MKANLTSNTKFGVVGLGLMGSSIVVSLLASGHQVIALAPIPGEKELASKYILDLLKHAEVSKILSEKPNSLIKALTITNNYSDLEQCALVQECVIEDLEIKKTVYNKIVANVSSETIIASNTSAIPISVLQQFVPNPKRFIGIHWAEPAYMTHFLEVTCGQLTDIDIAEKVMDMGKSWGKEPTLLRKDIRGFIANRLMYAVYREALALIENGHTNLIDADKVFRYDVGSWITVMGIFQRIGFMGAENFEQAFKQLIGKLSNQEEVSPMMEKMVEQNAKGIHNQFGLYPYNKVQAKAWEEAFARFNQDIYHLALRYRECNWANISDNKEEQQVIHAS